jgi:hypothetical protein
MTFPTTTNPRTTVPPLVTTIPPFQVTRKQLNALFNSPQLVKQMTDAGWITAVRPGKPGRETLYDYQSAANAYARLQAGEEPQPMTKTENHQLQEAK